MKNNLWCGCIVHRKTHCTQILRIMRLTVFFLLFIIFETYALNSYSQNQKVTMNKGTATLAEIIRQIEKQTDYLFIYNEREVSLKRKVPFLLKTGQWQVCCWMRCTVRNSPTRWKGSTSSLRKNKQKCKILCRTEEE